MSGFPLSGLLAFIALLAAVILGAPGPAGAFHPNHPLGVDPERAYQVSPEGIDRVDLFSGSLSVTLPIGPFTLSHNSNVWHYRTDPKTGEIRARPDWENTGGIGWHLGWGELYHPDHGFNEAGEWLYVDEDGSRHSLYDKLHRDDEDDGDTNNKVFYSRDGSYLRMRLSSNDCHAYVEYPDGSTRKLTGSCGPGTTYRLVSLWSPFASESDPDVTITYGVDPADPTGTPDTLRTVTNRYGLTHKVHLSDKMNGDPGDPVHWVNRIVTKVDLESFAGQRAVFTFTYRQIHVDVSCKDDSPTPDRIQVPHLERVDLPDGTAYSMVEDGDLLYENLCRNIGGFFVDDLPGVLNGINLPTGGQIRWTYQGFEFPPGDNNSVFNTGAGVKTRTLHTAGATATSANAVGTWTYKTTDVPREPTGVPGEFVHPEKHMEVVYPTGDCTKHFFDAIYWVDPVNSSGRPWGWERGLPFVYTEESDGKYLSVQVWTGNDGGGSCAGTKLRSTYVRYRHDTTPGTNQEPLANWYNTNRQVEATRTIFHDDGDRWIDTEHGDFDGLGHFRTTVETGNFVGGSQTSERRETHVDYNRLTTSYPASTTPLQISEPWVLEVFASRSVTEPEAHQQQTLTTEYGFEDATGFLECTRTYASGTERGPTDLLSVRTRDSRGRPVDEKLYGGDLQLLPTGGSGCGTLPSQPVYWNSHEYDPLSGGRVKTWPKTPAGVPGPFPTFDVDLEARTGIVLRSRDGAGFETVFDYDAAGRRTASEPQAGATVRYSYENPTATAQAKIVTTLLGSARKPSGGPKGLSGGGGDRGGPELTRRETVIDDFGRRRLERIRLPGGVWSEQETLYNARGWTVSRSEWADLAKATTVESFDPFGRPTVIRPPDGAARDRTLAYEGQRAVVRTDRIALAGGEAAVDREHLYDRYGRLRTVWEGSGAGGSDHFTSYAYDVGGRLARVRSGSSITGKQTRTFRYDGRGFLQEETHPEKGPVGGGSVFYHDHDAAGLAHRRVDGPHDLSFTFDFMGRPLGTFDEGHGSRPVRHFVWDSAPGFGLGKLHRAERYNYVDLPWNGAGEEAVVITQAFAYDGIGGLASVKETSVSWSSDDVRLTQLYTYDDLGNVAELRYPECTLPAACAGGEPGSGSGRLVSYTYDQERLVGVPGWAPLISYHPSGMWSQVSHANGVTEHQDRDDDFSRRPRRLYTTGTSPGYDTGVLTYDGTGNLKARGADAFTYDRAGRLVDAAYQDGAFHQSYSYDRYGNITAVDGLTFGMVTVPVDPETNRIRGASYDAAGNLLQAPSPLPPWPFAYNASNRVKAQAHMRYLYDAFGERAVSLAASTSQEGAIFHLRDLDHRWLGNVRVSQGSWSREDELIYAGRRLVAQVEPGAAVGRHFHLDRLGSVKMVTEANGELNNEFFFLPYGENAAGTTTWDHPLFTGHERDASTGSDYMHARHYLWNLGRFLSPDPVLGTPLEPQSWNRYAYVLGNPLKYTDPTGNFQSAENDEIGSTYYDVIFVFAKAPRRPSVSPFPGGGLFTGSGVRRGGGSGSDTATGQEISFASPLIYLGNLFRALDGIGGVFADIWNGTLGGLLDLPARAPDRSDLPPELENGGAFGDLAEQLGRDAGEAAAVAGAAPVAFQAVGFTTGFVQGYGPVAIGNLAFTSEAAAAGYSTLNVPNFLYSSAYGATQGGFLYGSAAYSYVHGSSILVGPAGAITTHVEIPFLLTRGRPLVFGGR